MYKINIDDTMLQTPGGDDTISDESDDFSHTVEQEMKDDGAVIASLLLKALLPPLSRLLWIRSLRVGKAL